MLWAAPVCGSVPMALRAAEGTQALSVEGIYRHPVRRRSVFSGGCRQRVERIVPRCGRRRDLARTAAGTMGPVIVIECPMGAGRRHRRASEDTGTAIGVRCCDSVDTLLECSSDVEKVKHFR